MQNSQPRTTLMSLIEGRHPESGAPLPNDSVIHRPDVIRSLLAAITALDQLAARAQRRSQLPDNVGRTWTTDEESRLVAAFRSGESPEAIARNHERTLRAIEARLQKLGLITEAERTTRGGFTAA